MKSNSFLFGLGGGGLFWLGWNAALNDWYKTGMWIIFLIVIFIFYRIRNYE